MGTASGTIGVLDVLTLKHATIVRSHTDIIYGLVCDPHNREFGDGVVRRLDPRVELDGNQSQLVEFEMPQGCSRCCAYHPTEHVLACGFDDGSVRVFDIASTSLLEEYAQHTGASSTSVPVVGGPALPAGVDGAITAYDVPTRTSRRARTARRSRPAAPRRRVWR